MAFVNVTVDTSALAQVATRDNGTVGIVGIGDSAMTEALLCGSYADVDTQFPTANDVSTAAKLALQNGAASVWVVDIGDTGSTTAMATGLALLSDKDIQVVVMANTVETDTDAYVSTYLKAHVNGAATERVGVFMLDNGETATTAPSAVTDLLVASEDRLFGIAHKSTNDVAAAVAGMLVSLKPWKSPVLKPLTGIVQTAAFTGAERTALAAAHYNTVIDARYLAGNGLSLESGYTMGSVSDGKYFVDVRRTIDDISYKMKTTLTNPNVIGELDINRSGLASLTNRITAVLQRAVLDGELQGFGINIPVANALAKSESARSAAETAMISTARTTRNVDVEVSVEYAGAIHSIDVNIKFTV